MIDMMTRGGRYTRSYAAAITAASAVIGPIIPPSIPMVLFALVSDASIGFLFMGGLIPGLLMAAGTVLGATLSVQFALRMPQGVLKWFLFVMVVLTSGSAFFSQ